MNTLCEIKAGAREGRYALPSARACIAASVIGGTGHTVCIRLESNIEEDGLQGYLAHKKTIPP